MLRKHKREGSKRRRGHLVGEEEQYLAVEELQLLFQLGQALAGAGHSQQRHSRLRKEDHGERAGGDAPACACGGEMIVGREWGGVETTGRYECCTTESAE